jgi:peptide/nickel transport system permease protein
VIAYVLRRLLYAIPVVIGVTLITFVLYHMVGGNPVDRLVGKKGTEEKRKEVAKEYGFDRPLPEQYLRQLKNVVTFDFGQSYSTRQDVGDMILQGLGPSLAITVPAFLLGSLLAIALGLFCAYYRGSLADTTVIVLATAAMSVSSLVYIILGQYFLAFQWRLFPVRGYESLPGGAAFLVLPWLIWIALNLGADVRFFRTVMLEEIRQDYARTAAAKGLPPRRILFKHVLKNSMIPIITQLVIAIPYLFVGALLLEIFFGIPGIGSLTVDALNRSDLPVIEAMVVIGSLLYVVFNVLSDVCYAVVDPRVRLK